MNARSRDCRLLGPALTAYAYREPHPEMRRLGMHLRACAACRRELDELRETRSWVERGLAKGAGAGGARGRWAGRFLGAAAFAAAAVVVVMLFAGGRRPGESLRGVEGAVPVVSRPPSRPVVLTARAFELDAFDARLEALKEGLGLAEEERW